MDRGPCLRRPNARLVAFRPLFEKVWALTPDGRDRRPHDKDARAWLKRARVVNYKSKDILRASGLPLLPLTNAHVKADERKIVVHYALSPLLLVRDPVSGRVIIADGYHRLCAVYAFDEDVVVRCKIV